MTAAARFGLFLSLVLSGRASAQQALVRPAPSAGAAPGMMVPVRRANPSSGVQGNRTFLNQPNLPGVSAPRVTVGRVTFAPALESMALPRTMIPQTASEDGAAALPEPGSFEAPVSRDRDIPLEPAAGLADPLVEGVPESPQTAVGRYVAVKTRQLSKPFESIRKLKNGRNEAARDLGQGIMDSILGQEGSRAQAESFLTASSRDGRVPASGLAEARETGGEGGEALAVPGTFSSAEEQPFSGAQAIPFGTQNKKAAAAPSPGLGPKMVALLTLEVSGQRLIFGTRSGVEQRRGTRGGSASPEARGVGSSRREDVGSFHAAASREGQDRAFVLSALGFREPLQVQARRGGERKPVSEARAWSRGFDIRWLPVGTRNLSSGRRWIGNGFSASEIPGAGQSSFVWLAAFLLAATLRRRLA